MFLIALLYSYFAKFVVFLIKTTGKGNGTTLPGYFIENYFPSLIKEFVKGYTQTILITGTNGKTTSRSIIVSIFENNSEVVCSNRGGANIFRGIAATLVDNWNWKGSLKTKNLILEVEEATLPKLTKYLDPNYLVFTNIFRDQLDAYGEIDTTLGYFRQSLNQTTSKIIINTDDQKLLTILDGTISINNNKKIKLLTGQSTDNPSPNRQIYGFGIRDSNLKMLDFEESSTLTKIDYQTQTLATKVKTNNLTSSIKIDQLSICNCKESLEVQTSLLGTYNVYNILTALSVTLQLFGNKSLESIKNLKPVFGRGEKIQYRNKELWIFLVKNPAGMNQVLNLIENNFDDENISICYLVNDKIADGKDVSWLWDCDFENYTNSLSAHRHLTSGTRGLDILLRLEHSNYDIKLQNNYAKVNDFIEKEIYSLSPKPQKYIILATYTAMMELRFLLSKNIKLPKINDEGN